MKSREEILEEEKRQQRAKLEDLQHELTNSELLRRAIEGDLQRTKIAASEKDIKLKVDLSQNI